MEVVIFVAWDQRLGTWAAVAFLVVNLEVEVYLQILEVEEAVYQQAGV